MARFLIAPPKPPIACPLKWDRTTIALAERNACAILTEAKCFRLTATSS